MGSNTSAIVEQLLDALERVAAAAFVPLSDVPDYDQPNGWRAIAVERIDIARNALVAYRGSNPPVVTQQP